MKINRLLLSLLVLFACAITARADYPPFDDAHRFVFYAVLEGCYEDGVSNEDLSRILMRAENGYYTHFVYACPLCTPAVHAFEAYKSRPRFSGLKADISTFGPGLEAELQKQLASEKSEERLAAINTLIQRWIARRMDMVNLSTKQRTELLRTLDEKRKKGAEMLEAAKAKGDYTLAPGFTNVQECAVCNGALGFGLPQPKSNHMK